MKNNLAKFVLLTLAVHLLSTSHAIAALTEVHVSELANALKKGLLSAKKETICTVTINSSEEKKSLIKNLPSSQFQIIELATNGSINDYGTRKMAFLVDACNSLNMNKVKCDQVIISTHFGNHYWGESGLRFNIDDLEQLSCSDVCKNVLSTPKTKIGFACNMNSDDEMGNRSPEQMRADLIRDGLSSNDADQAVQSVHTAAGMSYRQRHNLIFFGNSELIAFNKRAPSGPDMARVLDRAFDQGMKWSTQNSSFIKDLNQIKPNLGMISLKTNSDPSSRAKICKMVNPVLNNNQKLMHLADWLADKNWTQYYPRLVSLATQKDFFQELNDNGRNAFKTISQNNHVKTEILSILHLLKGATMKHRWAFVAWKAGWLDDLEFKNIVAESIIKFLRPPFPTDPSDRQDMVDEIGWMHKRYFKSNIDDGNIVSQFSIVDLNSFYENNSKKINNFFTQDIDLISKALSETKSQDAGLMKAFEKNYGYPLN